MCHLMKRYTPVTIIRLDTGASGMYQIPASGGRHLGNMVLPPPARLSHFSSLSLSLSLSLHRLSFHSAKFHQRPAWFTLPHCPSDMRSHFWLHNRRVREGQYRVSEDFFFFFFFFKFFFFFQPNGLNPHNKTFLFVLVSWVFFFFFYSLCVSPRRRGKRHQWTLPFWLGLLGYIIFQCLRASTGAQLEIQIRDLFRLQCYNHSQPISPLQRATVMPCSTQACSIEYLWVTGLRNSVWGIMTVENHFPGLGIGGHG